MVLKEWWVDEPARVPPREAIGARFSRQRRTATAPEIALRRELHARGRRFRVNTRIDGLPRRRMDLVFTGWRLVVLVDGCFWHGCLEHGTLPATNREWWSWKLAMNADRDADTNDRLRSLGWVVLRVWEHVPAGVAADLVEECLSDLGAPRAKGVDG